MTTMINNFSIEVATVNGSGSQTANSVLLRAIFQMGVPVSGKNSFPSNISGLPTWFQIRASSKGYTASKRGIDLMICLNPESAQDDVAKLDPGSLLIYDEPLQLGALRRDLQAFPVPFQALVAECCPETKLHRLVKNMIYVGVAAQMLGIDRKEILKATDKQLEGKSRAIELNQAAVQTGYDWAEGHLPTQDRLRIIRDQKTDGHLILDGNTACALGALFAGVTVVAWYPITPSSSVIEALEVYAGDYRRDPATGKLNLAIIQMEDELASAGVLVGAGWAGARAMTATSGPGISLMSEFIGFAYHAECPGVFIDVMRIGPSTGLPTRTSQGDVEICAKCSHGDAFHICLYPGSMDECFHLTYAAFDLAERFQTPVFVVLDLDLGMQSWITKPFSYPEKPLDRGKVLTEENLQTIQGWGRYKDIDGDGICWRTLPGTPGGKGAFFTRGSGHDANAHYSEKPENWKANIDRLRRKILGSSTVLPAPILESTNSRVGILAYGSSHSAVVEARDILDERNGIATDYLRIRAFPFAPAVGSFLREMETVYIVEQNRDGQMASLLRDFFPEEAAKFRSILHYDSTAITAQAILEQIRAFGK